MSPTPHPLRRCLSRLRLKEPGASWLLASHPREKCLFLPFCSSAFTSPSRRAELVWCHRDTPREGPSHPTTSGTLGSTIHPTNIYEALLGLPVMP